MRTGFLSLLALLCGSAVAPAQPESPAAPEKTSPPSSAVRPTAAQTEAEPPTDAVPDAPATPVDTAPASGPLGAGPGRASFTPPSGRPLFDFTGSSVHGDRVWVSAGYLRGWINQPDSSVPFLTTGPATAPVLGVLGQPGTTVLSSTDDLRSTLNGIQGEVGFWLDDAHRFSFFVDSFYLIQPTYIAFTTASDANGNPVISRPVVNAATGLEQSYLVAEPNLLAGSATIQSRSQFFGIEANGGYHHSLSERLLGTLLFGYRSLYFAESLTLQDTVNPLAANILTFDGTPVNPPSSIMEQAGFRTNNLFNGLQLGGKLRWQHEWFFVDTFAKVAMGWTDQRVNINGATAQLTPGASTQIAPGEVLTSVTNIGSERRQVIAVVPEMGVNLGVDLLSFLRLKAGYSALAWSGVARAADQIDRTVTTGRIPTDPDFGTITGPARPVRGFQDHILWLQAINVGVELHY